MQHRIKIKKEELNKIYFENKRSIKKTALYFNVSATAIFRHLKKLGIKTRERGIDLVNKRFNRLTVLKLGPKKHRENTWLCRCDCGNYITVKSHVITNGYTKSCGCILFDNGNKHFNWKGYGEISGHMFWKIKNGAKHRNHEFNITIEYIWELFLKQNRRCLLSGIQLNLGDSKKNKNKPTASLDRIDNSKGYVEGNVQWVHVDINFMKQDLSQEELINYCKLIYFKSIGQQPDGI